MAAQEGTDDNAVVLSIDTPMYSEQDRRRLHREIEEVMAASARRLVVDCSDTGWFGPPILDEEAQFRVSVSHLIRGCPLLDRRPQTPIKDPTLVLVGHILTVNDSLLHLHTGLESMRAGDIGHREPLGVTVLLVVLGILILRVIPEARRRFPHCDMCVVQH